MKRLKKIIFPLAAACGLLMLIIDAKNAIAGAQEGVNMCIKTLIPSLFPFFVISGYFCRVSSEINVPFLRPILKLCGMPSGTESLLIIGILGGYPVGAKTIADAWREGRIKYDDAIRLLGFCSNAGPAFVFGIIGGMFNSQLISWCLLAILILSAIFTGWLLPRNNYTETIKTSNHAVRLSEIFNGSLKSIASVCGWVILFRVILTVIKRWALWFLPDEVQIIIMGILELSNGCLALSGIHNEGLRFMLSAAMLSFGGLCVYWQTVSVTEDLGSGYYFPGKILQCLICLVLSAVAQLYLFPINQRLDLREIIIPTLIICLTIAVLKLYYNKKTVAFSRFFIYNTGNQV